MRRRQGAALLLFAVVTASHLWLAGGVLESRLGSGGADKRPARIEVAFVRELAPSKPPPVVAAPKPVRPRVAKRAPAPASAPTPQAAASAAEPPEVLATVAPAASASAAVVAEVASAPQPTASAPETAASAPVPFEWPPSTRLSYLLTGYYRGPVEGQATVEWLRRDSRYQVRFEIAIGPPFAPLLTRSFTSDGEVTEQGLAPRRYDEQSKVVFRDLRVWTVLFDDELVHLANGRDLPRPAGVQDTASQFVQLTWLFSTRPDLLEPGRSVDIPLALPRSMSIWTYDVVARETLDTGFGAIETLHVKPRREPRPGVEMTVELWIAPSLQYLPVRSRIRVDADTYADLLITKRPEQAAPGR